MPMADSLKLVVADYRRDHAPRAQAEANWFGDRDLSLADAIDRAALSVCPSSVSGKLVMHPHQCRVGHEKMGKLAARLARTVDAFRAAKTFEAIHALVRAEVVQVDGVGELAAYDVAHRIGIWCGARPERVYLNAGALEGAAALELGSGRRTLTVADLPSELRGLRAEAVEDLLCIFKDRLDSLRSAGRPFGRRTATRCGSPRLLTNSRC